jgi:hypothetical protein
MPKYQLISSFLQQEKTNSKTFKLLVTWQANPAAIFTSTTSSMSQKTL